MGRCRPTGQAALSTSCAAAQLLAQRQVQQVRQRVIGRDAPPPRIVDPAAQPLPRLERALPERARVQHVPAKGRHPRDVKHGRRLALGRDEGAGVGHLPAERGCKGCKGV